MKNSFTIVWVVLLSLVGGGARAGSTRYQSWRLLGSFDDGYVLVPLTARQSRRVDWWRERVRKVGRVFWRAGRPLGLDLLGISAQRAARLIDRNRRAARHIVIDSATTLCDPAVLRALNRTHNAVLTARISPMVQTDQRFPCAGQLRHRQVFLSIRGYLPLADIVPLGERLRGFAAVAVRYRDHELQLLRHFSELTILGLHGLRLATARGLAAIAGLKRLKHLALTQLSCPYAQLLRQLPQLRELDLSFATLDEASWQALGRLKLTDLRLFATNTSDGDLVRLWRMRSLLRLDLGATSIRGHGLRYLRFLRRLQVLRLNGNDPRGSQRLQTAALGELRALRVLTLPFFNLSDDDLRPLRSLRRLTELELYGNHVRGGGLRHLRRAPLRTLGWSGNGPPSDTAELLPLRRLRELSLDGENVRVSEVRRLWRLPRLQRLNLGPRVNAEVLRLACPKRRVVINGARCCRGKLCADGR